ncbi:MAG: Triosephosphate isomerase [Candidatus Yanofskybacteria bacterium GW2011_GWF1_44_227]|uniref:Triosephosphate isomerase n=1 Tax=Candidatus Yanofskybacteria bacterium GW2011_GWE2_40_11 TaxID=1619033 RepID=A0A0G0T199_9BACT|nr:MAG: Triosephosphate isomerase [Candidatus Yanofskybacteria bacterium GW2011_GWE2_40_11]KKT52653.1 MAG: Triosephosphate isomerase [Candidatus Yanofskybacteria bacterium GW2011_GWF1_44_227]OGN35412.1 MAG: hypothetical protein A2207_00265 [Candidatus Yanofskybacteria bacterium RIFOXYA1_FULL_44_17]OGN36499.1 MAG: hypothetical protein A2241_02040 [Candidatus Yanofskybacteria bacterium RIFOXYA2_FULL_45_28]OGN37159.1 MAG: hypothetical protein A2405_03670 [Candidatus Yanofskybacteria bacterium RIFO
MNKEKLIVSNWKNYIANQAQAQEILDAVNDLLESRGENGELSLVFCPDESLIVSTSELLQKSHLENSAFLGVQDLLDDYPAGLQYVILGHSSKRWPTVGDGETSVSINSKIKRSLEKELTPIVCIGEKDKGVDAEDFIKNQINKTFAGLTPDQVQNCIIVYEPVWAISGNPDAQADNPIDASNKIQIIRDYIRADWDLEDDVMVLYGGSVSSDNVVEFISKENIAGVLIGRASTQKEEFSGILNKLFAMQ